jgi:hypothetical protein
MPPRRSSFVLLTLLGLASLGAPCVQSRITAPREAQLVPDPELRVAATLERKYDPASVAVEIDGADVTAAIGLTPPFSDAGGVVVVGGVPVVVQDFDFPVPPTGPWQISLELVGLPEGPHLVEVSAVPTAGGATVTFMRSFSSVDGFALAAGELPAAGLRQPVGADGGKHRIASLGGDVAGPSVPLSDGGSVRAGFVAVAEQQRSGGTP